jgi:hypothetical protein
MVAVDLCKDRACTQSAGTATVSAMSTSATADAELPRGVVFWRVRTTVSGVEAVSPVWELFVPARTATNAVSWGSILDVNGDGLADLAAISMTRARIFFGNATGPVVQTDHRRTISGYSV